MGLFDGRAIDWTEDGGFEIIFKPKPQIRFLVEGTPYPGYFLVSLTDVLSLSPEIRLGRTINGISLPFELVLKYLREWLQDHPGRLIRHDRERDRKNAENAAIPSLWESISSSDEPLIGEPVEGEIEHEGFSTAEQARIAASFRQLREAVTENAELDPKQISVLDERFEYLIEASGRVSKKDWGLLVAGGLINIVTTASLSAEAAGVLWNATGAVFAWIGHSPLLLN